MKNTTNFRSKTFKRAHYIRKATGQKFSTCLAKAWDLYRLAQKMTKSEVLFAYMKKSGALRKAVGTLQGLNDKIKGTGESSSNVFCYYDLEAKGFRSFKIENLVF